MQTHDDTPSSLGASRGLGLEVFAVLAVTLLPGIYWSIVRFLLPGAGYELPSCSIALAVWWVLRSASTLLLLVYVGYVRRESLATFGVMLKASAIPVSVVLFLIISVINGCFTFFSRGIAVDVDPAGHKDALIYTLLNYPIAVTVVLVFVVVTTEEILCRAYLMTRLAELGCPTVLAILGSTALQCSYHIHYGLGGIYYMGVLFLVLSIYFARYRNAVVISLTHAYVDFAILAAANQ